MHVFRTILPACAATALLFCTACAPTRPVPTDSTSSAPSPASSFDRGVSASISVPPEVSAPDEPSIPTFFIPEATADTPVTPESVPNHPKSQQKAPDSSDATNSPAAQKPLSAPPPTPIFSVDYDFSQPIPESEPVDLNYFADAVFVGDSRSDGFYLYGVKRGKNLSSSGLSVFTFTAKKAFSVNGTRVSALEALSSKQYAKIYLGFGVNELGYINTDAFYRAYCDTVDAVRACQPTAVIYAQTIAPVNEEKVAAAGGKKHLNNDRVRLYNDLIRKAAQEKRIPLLDIYSALVVDGALPSDASRDGIHINREYSQLQLYYCRRHTVEFETLYPKSQPKPEVLPNETTDTPVVDSSADPLPDRLLPHPDEGGISTGAAPSASGN